MKYTFLFLLVLLSFAVKAQDTDEGLNLTWEQFVDSTDYTIIGDTADLSAPFDSVTYDTTYVVKFKSVDTISIATTSYETAYTTIVRIRTYEQQAQAFLDRMKAERNEQAMRIRQSMKLRQNAISAKQAYETFTDTLNANVAVYDEIWPKIPSFRIRTTITDSTDAYFVGDFNMTPNANGVVRDSSNTIVARIFPESESLWRVVIANDGSIPNGVSVYMYSDDRQRYVVQEPDLNVGRVFINLSRPLE